MSYLFLALALTTMQQAVDHDDVSILRGLECVSVIVGGVSEDEARVGLTAELQRTTVELRLRAVGVPVVDKESPCRTGTTAGLFVNVFVQETPLPGDVHYIFRFDLRLEELVQLPRNGRFVTATTWRSSGAIGYYPRSEVKETLQSGLRDDADSFANDYLKANPKSPPAKATP